jgi:hypothetical protein
LRGTPSSRRNIGAIAPLAHYRFEFLALQHRARRRERADYDVGDLKI